MAGSTTSLGRLLRYNYQVLAGTGYWVIVLPVAASQIVSLYMMALASQFDAKVAMRIAELMTPILGAFLVAHSLAPEYRSGIGAVLASKPVSLYRVVALRVLLSMLGAVALVLVTLGVCSLALKPINVWVPLLMSLPGLVYLAMIALTFATVFANALAGFAVAAIPWAFDLALGFGFHPLLSLQGRRAAMEPELMSEVWPYGKIALLVVGVALLLLHGRLLQRVCVNAERKDIARAATWTALALLLYCYSGAAVSVGYAHAHRGHLTQNDVTWLRRKLGVYGPVPVDRLFGRPFARYVNAPKARKSSSASDVRRAQLEQALKRWPKSIWADGIAFALGAELERSDPVASADQYRRMAAQFPDSPFAPLALRRIVRSSHAEVDDERRLAAARDLLQDYADKPEADRAASYLEEHYPG